MQTLQQMSAIKRGKGGCVVRITAFGRENKCVSLLFVQLQADLPFIGGEKKV